jgi:hypothetical protein
MLKVSPQKTRVRTGVKIMAMRLEAEGELKTEISYERSRRGEQRVYDDRRN